MLKPKNAPKSAKTGGNVMRIPDAGELFSSASALTAGLFSENEAPYLILTHLKEYILSLIKTLGSDYTVKDGIAVANDAKIEDGAYLHAPAIIGHGSIIRHGAYIRGSVLIAEGCTVGNSSEIKNSVILEGAALAHYNYVGDSIVGCRAHLGAGATVSNLRLDRSEVRIGPREGGIMSGMKKLGALIGDGCEIGCGAVLMPGTVIGKGARIYPLAVASGIIASGASVHR
jgi:NDP-sugar pyrophosphorylase family protein